MNSSDIRKAFLDFYASKGHEVVASGSLVPHNDPTLLFTNAGMNQFKDLFLGLEQRPYTKATTSQRCVRAGGKHNDLENVGYTARHHTFFEMLGNFSFGDYFKRDAIAYAWEFLTVVLKLPKEKLWVTVYKDDDEAEAIWKNEMGIDPTRFSKLGEKDNFWSMGDTGPCGPCTEIFYDHGEQIWGGPPGSPDEDGDRYIEIWNLVFMQFNRTADGKQELLPKPSVDTGMGLERLAAVLQHVHSNYEIDLFQNILKAAAQIVGEADHMHASLRVIADHIRSTSFLIADGVLPSNEGRGYVLRRIIRRAIRHGHKLGKKDAFFNQLVPALVKEMGIAYPELIAQEIQIMKVLAREEEQFAKTLDNGMKILEEAIAELSGDFIPGEVAFKLYDTYGFPLDLTADIARERNLTVDEDGFEICMAKQKEMGRAADKFGMDYNAKINVDGETLFTGYKQLNDQSTVRALYVEGEQVDSVSAGQDALLVFDQTPFYGESGGQIGDTGQIALGDTVIATVIATTKEGNHHVHRIKVLTSIKQGLLCDTRVDRHTRQATAINHSATHLLHAALREVVGDHVTQKGSLVDAEKLRFDFSHYEPVTSEQIQKVEAIVNAQVIANTPVNTRLMEIEEAKKSGAMALFGEKYDDQVRVLSMGDGFSIELCGGTHVNATGDIGFVKVIAESGIAAGVRRIEAVSGFSAYRWADNLNQQMNQVAIALKTSAEQVLAKLAQQNTKQKQLEKELEALKHKLAGQAGEVLVNNYVAVSGVKLIVEKIEDVDNKGLVALVETVKNKLQSVIVVLASINDGKVMLAVGVSKDLTKQYRAGDLVKFIAEQVGGKGGGRPDIAQAGGTQPEKLEDALASVTQWVEDK